jgi:hypothetical protein
MRQNAGIEGSIQIKGVVGKAGNFTTASLKRMRYNVQVTLSSVRARRQRRIQLHRRRARHPA